jgi:cell division protein FtsN
LPESSRIDVLKSRDLAQHTQDDGFREIQLSGKQLVFLFMVATVFSVVVFLCGVFVGRGVRAERPALAADGSASSPVTTPDVVASSEPAPPPAGSDPRAAAPPPAVDELSYFNRLDKSSPAAEDLKPAGSRPAPAARAAAEPPPAPKKEPTAAPTAKSASPAPGSPPAPATSSPPAPAATPATAGTATPATAGTTTPPATATPAAEPAGQGFALQITALREKNEAETIARRLSSKGYSAYVMTPAKGTPSVYRVRVGKFKTRREAEAMATRLKKEEQFTPWITR